MSKPPRANMELPTSSQADVVRDLISERGYKEAAQHLRLDKLTLLKIASGRVPVHPLTLRAIKSWCDSKAHAA